MVRSTFRILAAATALACTLALPPPAAADEPANGITTLTVGAASIDVTSSVPVVVVHFVCAADLPWVRVHFTLVQRDAMPIGQPSAAVRPDRIRAVSVQTMDALRCTTGSAVDVAIRFGPQQGVFTPGRAEITGFAASMYPAGTQSIEAAPIILRPAK